MQDKAEVDLLAQQHLWCRYKGQPQARRVQTWRREDANRATSLSVNGWPTDSHGTAPAATDTQQPGTMTAHTASAVKVEVDGLLSDTIHKQLHSAAEPAGAAGTQLQVANTQLASAMELDNAATVCVTGALLPYVEKLAAEGQLSPACNSNACGQLAVPVKQEPEQVKSPFESKAADVIWHRQQQDSGGSHSSARQHQQHWE